jgi:hypothetical protein
MELAYLAILATLSTMANAFPRRMIQIASRSTFQLIYANNALTTTILMLIPNANKSVLSVKLIIPQQAVVSLAILAIQSSMVYVLLVPFSPHLISIA